MNDELPIGARVALWAGCKIPTRHIRNDLLENASYTAIHYGGGAAQASVDADLAAARALQHDTITIRAGTALQRMGLMGERRAA